MKEPGNRRLVAVSGVSRGLGAALLGELLRLGHSVAGCARSSQGLESLQKAHSEAGSRLHLFEADVADDLQVGKWAAAVIGAHGAPDILVNNAARINRNAPLWTLSAEELNPIIRTNIEGSANCIRHFFPSMLEAGRGVIVNLSSYWGRSVAPEVAPYCATKFAIEGMTRALAEELPAPFAAIPLNPGIIDTEMLRSCFNEGAASYERPDSWAQRAAPLILGLSRKDNGKSLTVPS